MNRRSFLKGMLIGAAAIAVAPLISHRQDPLDQLMEDIAHDRVHPKLGVEQLRAIKLSMGYAPFRDRMKGHKYIRPVVDRCAVYVL